MADLDVAETPLAALPERIAEAEAGVRALREGCEKRLVWADGARRTETALVFVHGFSASPNELRPAPDRIAEGLGANLYFTRLAGHGQDGDAMGEARFDDWLADLEETAEIATAIGKRVIWMGCSTGGTLATLAAMRGLPVDGLILVSPNYELTMRPAGWLLDAPGVETWGPMIMGRRRRFRTINEDHARYWTADYPTRALIPMADAMRAVRREDASGVTVPALFAYCRRDLVVRPGATERIMQQWGGPAEPYVVDCGPDDDRNGHVIAGDVFSPGQTDGLVAAALDWARRHL